MLRFVPKLLISPVDDEHSAPPQMVALHPLQVLPPPSFSGTTLNRERFSWRDRGETPHAMDY